MLPRVCRFKTLLAALFAGLLPAAFVLGGVPSPAAADYASDCGSPTRTLSGGSASAFSVAAGEVVLLTGGSYTGGVNEFPAGATICVADDVTFAPSYVNNAAGTLDVRGTATLPGIAVNGGFELGNEGKTTFSGSFNQNATTTLTNAADAELVASSQFILSGGSTLDNAGTMTAPSFTINSNSTLTNSSELTTDQLIANGPVNNTGQITIDGAYTANSGGTLDNECLIDVAAGWTNNDTAKNSGRISVAAGTVLNQGVLEQSPTGQVQGADFTNNQQVTGFGRYRFTGNTLTQGSFAGSSASDPILFWDTTSSGDIFDTSSGTVSNVVRSEVDAGTGEPAGCEQAAETSADLQVTKTGPATVTPGGTVTYTVTVENLGPGPAANTVVTDTLPAELADVTASDGGTVSGGEVTWTVGALPSGETRAFTITGTAPESGTFENVVSGTSDGPDPDGTNNDGSSDSARVTTTVDQPPPPVNHPPVVEDRTEVIDVNGTVVDALAVSDPDEGQTVHVTLDGEPANGTAIVAPAGGFSYRPDTDFTGRDTFTVRACDNGTPVLCDTTTVYLVVRPLAHDDTAMTEPEVPVTIDVKANDSGTTTDPTVVADPSNGTATAGPDGSLVYTPNSGFTGTDEFTYRICAPAAPDVCAQAVVSVTTVPAKPLPEIGDDEFTEVTGTEHEGHLTESGPEPAPPVTTRLGAKPAHGAAVVEPSGDYTYTPDPGFAGNDTFTVIACDDGDPQLCATGRVIAHITPIANDDEATTPKVTPVAIDIGRNDLGTVDPATITVQPEHGSATIEGATKARAAAVRLRRPLATNRATYTPDPGFTGVDRFTYRICASGAADLCDTAAVTITVTGGDTPPPGPSPTPAPTPTTTPTPSPTSTPGPHDSSDLGGHASGTNDGLPHTGADGLGTVLFAALAITGLAVVCLIVGFKVSRREEE
jgi:uncharacterized repeat protein (TIGR01451 family)